LVGYLKLNDFDVYICSGGGIDFIRAISEDAYGIPPENVIGSAVQKTFEITAQGTDFIRQPKLVEPINDKEGKPVNINRYIGKKPAIAVGNSDGDIQMLQYTDSNPKPDLELLLHHDDLEREYDYNTGTEKALILAKENDWTIISLKKDFKRVFPFSIL
jgi:phosphoserine phosphatase